jgi:orotidine-5'-phosphate decarboxylase
VGEIGGLKLGLEFMTVQGVAGYRAIAELGLPIFLDLKFHDIPNTVAGAVRGAAALPGCAMLTVHAAGGAAMLAAAVAAAREAARPPSVLAVTVLTSFDDADLEACGVGGGIRDQVLRLADLAVTAGVDGLVCSPVEIGALRLRFGRDLRLVVPGIRPAATAPDDQKRTMTPLDALAAGADVLVIGRPITAAPDPKAAARQIAAGLRRAA